MNRYPASRWVTLFGLTLLTFTGFLDITIVNTALPFIQRDLQASIIQLQWVLNIMAIIFSMLMVVTGRLGDLFGRTRIFFIGVTLFAIGALGTSLAPTMSTLIFFRAFQAAGGATMLTVSSSMLPQLFPEEERAKALSFYSGFTGLGLAIGPFLGGLLIHWLNWRAVFWINLPIIAIGVLLCLRQLAHLPNVKNSHLRLDLPGTFLLMLSIGLLVFGIVHGGQMGWNDNASWLCVITGSIALARLILVEIKTKDPILDFTMFKNKLILLSLLNTLPAGLICFVLMFIDPLYLHTVRDQPAIAIGLLMLAAPIMQILVSALFNRAVHYFNIEQLLLFSIGTAFFATLGHVFMGINSSYILLVAALMFAGITWGLANTATISAAMKTAGPEHLGGTIGTIFTAWNLSGAIFLAFCSVVLHNKERSSLLGHLVNLPSLSSDQIKQLIHLALTDPLDIRNRVLAIVGPAQENQTLEFFKMSFFEGYHAVTWIGLSICLTCFLAGILLHRK